MLTEENEEIQAYYSITQAEFGVTIGHSELIVSEKTRNIVGNYIVERWVCYENNHRRARERRRFSSASLISKMSTIETAELEIIPL